MTKKQFIAELSMLEDFESKAAARRATELMIDIITNRLASGEEVDISGLGKFYPKELAAREGVAMGAPYNVPARTVPRFRAASKFKRAL